MFSETVRDGKMRASWNDRPRPATDRRLADQVPMSTPSSSIRPPVDGEYPGDEVQDGCLARPVRADQPQSLTTTQLERDIVDGDDPAEAFGEAVGGEDDRLRRQWVGPRRGTPGR